VYTPNFVEVDPGLRTSTRLFSLFKDHASQAKTEFTLFAAFLTRCLGKGAGQLRDGKASQRVGEKDLF
jgi:hypothetical protein